MADKHATTMRESEYKAEKALLIAQDRSAHAAAQQETSLKRLAAKYPKPAEGK